MHVNVDYKESGLKAKKLSIYPMIYEAAFIQWNSSSKQILSASGLLGTPDMWITIFVAIYGMLLILCLLLQ